MVRLEILACAFVALSCGGETKSVIPGVSQKACTEIGCENGVNVDFTLRERGSYEFIVTVDGVKTTCRATLPLPRDFFQACDRSDVLLGLVGSMLPPEQQSIEGLRLPSATNASEISIEATRDGASIGSKTFKPAYDVRPGPNGPDCEPKECKLARATFP